MEMSELKSIIRKVLLKLSRPLERWGLFDGISDERWLKARYWLRFGRMPDLDDPKTYNEKLQWLKLHYHIPQYTDLVDKYEVKKFVAERIGQEYVIPTLGVWDRFEDIDFDSLPDRFVLKCTHDSGGLVICKDKSKLDLNAARKKIQSSLKNDYYLRYGREWPYKNVRPRIMAEQYMEDTTTNELRDYKFFSFDGKVRMLFVATDRYTPGEETKFDFFDPEYRWLDLRQGHPNAPVPPQKPRNFEKMKELTEMLSAGMPHVRVDLYEVDGKVYFGELTFYHFCGYTPFVPGSWDEEIGRWLTLPEKNA